MPWLFGSTDVVWPTFFFFFLFFFSWLCWIATSRRSADVSGRQLGIVLKPITHGVPRNSTKNVRVTRFPAPPPDAKRPSRARPFPEICSPVPDVNGGALFSKCDESQKVAWAARSQGQPVGREEDSDTSDENVPLPVLLSRTSCFWTTTSPPAQSAQSPECGCDGARSAVKSSNRAWRVPQVCEEGLVPRGPERQSQRYRGLHVRTIAWVFNITTFSERLAAVDGSLVVIQPLWVQPTQRPIACGENKTDKRLLSIYVGANWTLRLVFFSLPALFSCSFLLSGTRSMSCVRCHTFFKDGAGRCALSSAITVPIGRHMSKISCNSIYRT